MDGAIGLDSIIGLVDWGHPGSPPVGDRTNPADRQARAVWVPGCPEARSRENARGFRRDREKGRFPGPFRNSTETRQ